MYTLIALKFKIPTTTEKLQQLLQIGFQMETKQIFKPKTENNSKKKKNEIPINNKLKIRIRF